MRKSVILVVLALLAIWVGWSLPPVPLAPEAGTADASTAGVVHVHTIRSDGRSTPDAIAAIAAQAGLKFVVLTDHGDATRQPDPPAYVSGVLMIDAVEISTDSGHLVALNLPKAPYPLAGEARDVIEDVHRLGGFAVAAHPDSPKVDLRWTAWDTDIDGVELLNLDTAWRARSAGSWRDRLRLVQAASTYLFRPAPSIATLTRNDAALQARWAELAKTRRLVIFSGADAHARLDLRSSDDSDGRFSLALPSYRAVFQTMSTRVRTAEPLTGDAAHDAQQVIAALTAGRAYTVFDALLTPPAFSFEATSGAVTVTEGESITADGEVTLSLKTNAPLPFKAVLFRDGEAMQEASSSVSPTWRVPPDPALYRIEIRATDRVPEQLWLMSNPIYVNLPGRQVSRGPVVATPAPASATSGSRSVPPRALFDGNVTGVWTSESAADSKTAVNVLEPVGAGSRELLFRYGLPGGRVFGQYAAAVVNTSGGIAPYGALSFTARSEGPVRLSIQLRQEGSGGQGWRWQRTVFLDATETTHTLALDDFRPMGPTLTPRAPLEHVSSVLLAVDQTNTSPGSSGRVWFRRVALE